MKKVNDPNIQSSSQSRSRLFQEIAQAVAQWQNAVQAFDEAAARYLGTNLTDMRCLGALFQRGSMTAGQLADTAGVTTGAITAAVDRLERAGIVTRVRDTADRRRVLIELTPDTRQAIDDLWGPLATDSLAELSERTDEELVLFRDLMRANSRTQLVHADRVRALPPRRPASNAKSQHIPKAAR